MRRSFSAVLILGSLLSWSASGAAASTGVARLLKDINQTPANRGSYPNTFQRLGSLVLFPAYTPGTGFELWRTDGTQAGTSLVMDINPGGFDGVANGGEYGEHAFFGVLDGVLLFAADDGIHGPELWRTDGTETGTRMLKDINPGPYSPFVENWQHIEVGGIMYFVADDGVHGVELWRSDGTEAGTFMLGDIFPGPQGAFEDIYKTPYQFVGAGLAGSLYFRALDPDHGFELWKTDGTIAGTVLVKDINPFGDSYPDSMVVSGGVLFFEAYDGTHGVELWRSDGTDAGTFLVKDLNPGVNGAYSRPLADVSGVLFFVTGLSPYELYRTDGTSIGTWPVQAFADPPTPLDARNGSLLFVADDGVSGDELWRTDGTPEGTSLVKDIQPGPAGSSIVPGAEFAGMFFFSADDGVHGQQMWKTDGTDAGTTMVKDITSGAAGASIRFFPEEGALFLIVGDDARNLQLWRSDGTESGTRLLPAPKVSFSAVGLGGKLLFGADDTIHGLEPWTSDGTDAGTALLKDVNPSFQTDTSETRFLAIASVPGIGNRMLFTADDGIHGPELWRTDGRNAGTVLVKDICPGAYGSTPSPAIAHDGVVFFAADDCEHGMELWKSDGTEEGTVLVADIFPGANSSMPSFPAFVEFSGFVYFAADDGAHGRTLWRSDGTRDGTIQVSAVDVPTSSFNVDPDFNNTNTAIVGDELYFCGSDSQHGPELWKTDGTEIGTILVKDIFPGTTSSLPANLAEVNDKLFFTARDSAHGYEPWLSDGTEAGTFLLKDINPGRGSSMENNLAPVSLGGYVFFQALSDSSHHALWKTDGTEAGTQRLQTLLPDSSFSRIDALVLWRGVPYFTACGAEDRCELGRSDGTVEGTTAVADLVGSVSLTAFEDGLLFAARDDDHGLELWRSDGTRNGTIFVQDIASGADWSSPQDFVSMGDRILFIANDDQAGFEEPWVAHSAILFGRPAAAIEDLRSEVRDLRLPHGVETSLTAKLDAAAQDLSDGRITPTVLVLEAFERSVEALAPRKISEASAVDLEEFAGDIVNLLDGRLYPAIHNDDPGPRVTIVPGRTLRPSP